MSLAMDEAKKMNLVVFTREYPVGMAGTKRIQHLLDYLLLKGILISVIAFRGNIPQPAVHGLHNSIQYINVGHGIKMSFSQIHLIVLYYLRGLRAIMKSKKRGFLNIIYNAGGISIENFLLIFWSRILGFKLVLAIEEDYSFFTDNIKLISRFKFWTIKRMDFLNCRLADEIIVISTYLRDKYLRMMASNVTLIPITAKINFNEKKKSFNSPLQVVYAGTFADKDGVRDIIKGFLTFNKSYDNARLILTGKSAQQENYREQYRNEQNILFKGFMEDNDFYILLRNSDVLCMCRNESGFANAGFPFKLGEYLATGNPVICTKVSDVEYYLDNEDVYLIDPGCPDQISASLERIVHDPVNARNKGLNGLEKCRKFFSAEINGQILFDVLDRIPNNGK